MKVDSRRARGDLVRGDRNPPVLDANTAAERARARRVTASFARSADECVLFLDQLGLRP